MADGQLIPTPTEDAKQSQRWAEQAQQQAERLAAQLRLLGIEAKV